MTSEAWVVSYSLRYSGVTAGHSTCFQQEFSSSISLRSSAKYADTETGLVYYTFRYRNTSTGRWLSRDPLGEVGGPNRYSFVNNAPMTFVDPHGLNAIAIDPGTITIVIVGGGAAITAGEVIAIGGGAIVVGGFLYLYVTTPPSPITYPNFGPQNSPPSNVALPPVVLPAPSPGFNIVTVPSQAPAVAKCDAKKKTCPPCSPYTEGTLLNKVTHTDHDHGGCLALIGSMTHWHYDIVRQKP